MTEPTDFWIVPALLFLAEWSLRWGLVLLVLVLWLTLRPPQRATTRHLLCTVALGAGLLLPAIPRWRIEIPMGPAKQATVVGRPNAQPPRLTEVSGPGLLPRTGPSALASRLPERKPDIESAPSPPEQAPLRGWRLAAIGVATIWVLSVFTLSIRLASGRRLLARLKAQALPCDENSERLLAECRRALGLSRPSRLAMHPEVASPVVIGGRQPLVLVPPDWNGWPDAHRRDCLRHELAHLKRRDDWAKLIQELVSVPFFFHPLVRWLLKRLDRERELLCDEAVVALGGDPIGYARLLLDLAQRPGRLLRPTAVLRPGWLPFFDRSTIAVRIERLLEDEMMRSVSPPSVPRLIAAGTLALTAALGIGGLQVQAVEPTAKQDNPTAKQPEPQAEPARAKQPRAIEGLIFESKGKPAAGATVVAGFRGSAKPNHQVFKTDDNGRFIWPIPEGPLYVSFVAYKEGRAPTFWVGQLPAEKQGERVERTLPVAEPFKAILVDGEGRPVAGERVRIEMFGSSFELPGSREGRRTTSVSYSRVDRDLIDGSPLQDLFQTITDRTGAFTFPSRPLNAWLNLGVTAEDGRKMRIRAEEDASTPAPSGLAEPGFVTAKAGTSIRLVASPAARVAGRVTTALPGVNVAGLRISFQDSNPEKGKANGFSQNLVSYQVLTDEKGRFVLDGLNNGTINIFVNGEGEGEKWTHRAGKDVPLKSGETTDVTLELIRGVEVEGKVVASDTGQPVKGVEVAEYGPRFPLSGAATQGNTTDAQGRYHFRLPAGETYFYVMGVPAGYTSRVAGKQVSRTVTIPEGAARFDVPPLQVAAAVAVRGRIVNAQGAPVAGVNVLGVCEGAHCIPFPGLQKTLTDASGGFRLPDGWPNRVPIGQSAKLLIRLHDGSEQQVVAVPQGDGSFTAKLSEEKSAPETANGTPR